MCPCNEAGCPTGVCGVLLRLGESCREQDGDAEVFVNGCLEAAPLLPGKPFVACAFVVAGEAGPIVARTATTQWGPFDYRCEGTGGRLEAMTLECGGE